MIELETENKYFAKGLKYIAGVDEAGRGPLAGPVVAACVVIDSSFKIDSDDLMLIADSKKLSSKKREMLFPKIKESVLAVEISVINNDSIDKINVLRAALLAMKKAINKLDIKPDIVLVDGNQKIRDFEIMQETIIDGDQKVWTIAAASIIAKVSRDYLMKEFANIYPAYGFEKHKGYGTKFHLEKLNELGPCPIHRKSFAPVKKLLEA